MKLTILQPAPGGETDDLIVHFEDLKIELE